VSSREQPIGDDDLHAYVDGRLAPKRKAEVEAYLAVHPAAAAATAADIEIVAALREHFAAKGEEPIPARLRIANILAERRRVRARRFVAIAASAAWLLVGAGTGWIGNDALHGRNVTAALLPDSTTRDAITAYRTFVVEKLHPVEVRADQEAHLAQWLSRRLGRPISAPDLKAQGYELMGGRLLPASQGPAAMFMYADQAGDRLTLYVRAGGSDAEAGFRFEREDDVSAFSWVDRDLSYVVAARTDRPRLLTIAETVDHQLRHDAPRI